MAKYELKTKVTDENVLAYINTVDDANKRTDCLTLIDMMQAVTGAPPKMWGTSIVGFAKYHYKYATGHEGDMCTLGFSPRKAAISIYLTPYFAERSSLFVKLGKHKVGKGCLYIKKLSDVDVSVLKEIFVKSIEYLAQLQAEKKL